MLRAGYYSHLMQRAHIARIRRFHRGRDPIEMGAAEVGAYPTHLAVYGLTTRDRSSRLRSR